MYTHVHTCVYSYARFLWITAPPPSYSPPTLCDGCWTFWVSAAA